MVIIDIMAGPIIGFMLNQTYRHTADGVVSQKINELKKHFKKGTSIINHDIQRLWQSVFAESLISCIKQYGDINKDSLNRDKVKYINEVLKLDFKEISSTIWPIIDVGVEEVIAYNSLQPDKEAFIKVIEPALEQKVFANCRIPALREYVYENILGECTTIFNEYLKEERYTYIYKSYVKNILGIIRQSSLENLQISSELMEQYKNALARLEELEEKLDILLDGKHRDMDVDEIFQLSRAFSLKNIRGRLISRRYQADLYYLTGSVNEKNMKDFFRSRKKAFFLIGEAGSGKTNLLCHAAEEQMKAGDIVLFFTSQDVGEQLDIRKSIEACLRQDLFDILRCLAAENQKGESPKQLLVFFDGVDEFGRLEVNRFIDEVNAFLLSVTADMPIKLIYSLKYQLLRNSGDLVKPQGLLEDSGVQSVELNGINLNSFDWSVYYLNSFVLMEALDEEQIGGLYKFYKGKGMPSPLDKDLPGSLSDSALNPGKLRLIMEVYSDKKLPKMFFKYRIIEDYCTKILAAPELRISEQRVDEMLCRLGGELFAENNSEFGVALTVLDLKDRIAELNDDILETLYRTGFIEYYADDNSVLAFEEHAVQAYYTSRDLIRGRKLGYLMECLQDRPVDNQDLRTFLYNHETMEFVLYYYFKRCTADRSPLINFISQVVKTSAESAELALHIFLLELSRYDPDSLREIIMGEAGLIFSGEKVIHKLLIDAAADIRGKENDKLAVMILEALLQLLEETETTEEFISACLVLGRRYKELGYNDKGLECLRKAQAKFDSQKDKSAAMFSYVEMGLVYRNMRRFEDALQCFENGETAARELEDWVTEGKINDYKGTVYVSVFDYRQALQYFYKARDIFKHHMDEDKLMDIAFSDSYAIINKNIATALIYTGAKDKEILEHLDLARDIFEQMEYGQGLVSIYSIYYLFYKIRGKVREAFEALFSQLEILSDEGPDHLLVDCLNTIGCLYRELQQNDEALQYFQYARDIAEALDIPYHLAASYDNLGTIYRKKGDYKKALSLCRKALKIFAGLNFKKDEAICYTSLGLIYSEMDEYTEAIEYFSRGIKLFEEIGLHDSLSKNHFYIAALYEAMGKKKRALEHCMKAEAACPSYDSELLKAIQVIKQRCK